MAVAPFRGMAQDGQPKHFRIWVLSDRAIFRDCVLCFLQRQGFVDVVGATSIAAFRRRPDGRQAPDLVLLDLRQETADPGRLLHRLRERWPRATVVAIGTPMELAAHAREADGCLALPDARAHDIVAIATAVEQAPGGPLAFPPNAEVERERRRWSTLTEREREVLDTLASGADNLKMAALLGVSERAVKAHISSLFQKLGVQNRTELALLACHAGLHCPTVPTEGSLSYS